jgi:hypothetical protein
VAISSVAQVRTSSQALGSARLLLLVIASHVSPVTGLAWPSVPTLARECRLSDRTVYRLLRKLETSGELEIIRRSGRVNRYRIVIHRPGQPIYQPLPSITPTPDTMPADESPVKERMSLARLDTWLTPGSRIWHMLTEAAEVDSRTTP